MGKLFIFISLLLAFTLANNEETCQNHDADSACPDPCHIKEAATLVCQDGTAFGNGAIKFCSYFNDSITCENVQTCVKDADGNLYRFTSSCYPQREGWVAVECDAICDEGTVPCEEGGDYCENSDHYCHSGVCVECVHNDLDKPCPGDLVCEDNMCVGPASDVPCADGGDFCEGELYCVDSACVECYTPTNSDGHDPIDCGDGFVCREGMCKEDGDPTEQDTCGNSDGHDPIDCGDGFVCREGMCKEDGDPTEQDTCGNSDATCNDDQTCIDGECVTPCEHGGKYCKGELHCVEKTCVECTGPSDDTTANTEIKCDDGYVCRDGKCEESDSTSSDVPCSDGGDYCSKGHCNDGRCLECDDAHPCDDGLECVNGACHRDIEPECYSDADCYPDDNSAGDNSDVVYVCIDYMCQHKTERECDANSEDSDNGCSFGQICNDDGKCTCTEESCGEKHTCRDNLCYPKVQDCTSNDECEGGYICIDHACVVDYDLCIDEDIKKKCEEAGLECFRGECIKDECDELLCDLKCHVGFLYKDGCPICECKPLPCPLPICEIREIDGTKDYICEYPRSCGSSTFCDDSLVCVDGETDNAISDDGDIKNGCWKQTFCVPCEELEDDCEKCEDGFVRAKDDRACDICDCIAVEDVDKSSDGYQAVVHIKNSNKTAEELQDIFDKLKEENPELDGITITVEETEDGINIKFETDKDESEDTDAQDFRDMISAEFEKQGIAFDEINVEEVENISTEDSSSVLCATLLIILVSFM
eukprot:TRINITY_DN7331_c0_g1_i1.p1 TRINITY_DN7331_c0_g1~~TRINITY_DN7331_c0_g1_i1.p1  ORF type:complete len:761 (+),score=235.96 TRINITY_DN7331_c0_g1_i1:34-2316(+)